MSETAVATVETANTLTGLNTGGDFYTSLSVTTQAEKLAMLKAINESQPLAENLNTPIALADFVAQAVQIENEATGELNDAVRITLIDSDGNAFHATSKGIFQQVKNIIKILGEPREWKEPVVVTAHKEGAGARKYLTLKY